MPVPPPPILTTPQQDREPWGPTLGEVGDAAVDLALHVGKLVLGGVLAQNPTLVLAATQLAEGEAAPGTPESDRGCIYCVGRQNTSSGRPYVGSADDLGQRAATASDGRDRTSNTEVVGDYPKGDREARRNAEQQAINDRGGVGELDNRRNEVAERHWEGRGIEPPR